MSENTGVAPKGPPPADLAAFTRDVRARLLGPLPAGLDPGRPATPNQWPQNKVGAEFLFRGFARLLWERGGTMEAADSVRRDLETGAIVTVVIDDYDGTRHPVEARLWEAAVTSRLMYSTGRVSLRHAARRDVKGDLYLVTAEPERARAADAKAAAPDWWPKPAQHQVKWATDPVVVREAERRLEAAGVPVAEAALTREMADMASEAGVKWTAPSIERVRRRSRLR